MQGQFIRTEMLIGHEAVDNLSKSKVAIFGVGGVGTYVAEGLVRTGVGHFVLVDDDKISVSNINRQIHANVETIGLSKIDTMKQRMLLINPDVDIKLIEAFVLYDNIEEIITNDIDYIVDALDTVTAKIAIAMIGYKNNIPVISSMGTGNKLDPEKLMISDIYKTSVCPLCKVMRKELKKRGLPSLKVVYSKEEPIKPQEIEQLEENVIHQKRATPGSVVFVPGTAGFLIASEVIKDLSIMGKNR